MIEMAPAFDNGTSLGHEISETTLQRPWTDAQFDGYIRRGRHHCGWSAADDRRGRHIDLCVRYVDAFPQAGEAMRNVLRFAPLRVNEIVQNCLRLGALRANDDETFTPPGI